MIGGSRSLDLHETPAERYGVRKDVSCVSFTSIIRLQCDKENNSQKHTDGFFVGDLVTVIKNSSSCLSDCFNG